MSEIEQRDHDYIVGTYNRFPVDIVSGQGAVLTDVNGKEYIDLGSGIAVNTFGACDPVWIDAVTAQLHQIAHTSNLYFTAPQTRLAKMLCERTGMKKVFFGNSGAEANEGALKIARKWGNDATNGQKHVIVTLKNSFHGRTIATLAATGQDHFHQHFGPFPEGFRYVTAGDKDELEQALAQGDVCAVLMEMVQGEGGVNVLEPDFVTFAAEACKRHDALLMVDEVQTGNGRTGKLCAYMHYGITPDVVTTAKGLAGGLPMGAVLMGEKVENVLGPGDHGSTFGGNPVCAAGACSVMERLDDQLMADVQRKSELIRAVLENAAGVTEVTGLGLMLGVATRRPAADVAKDCLADGLLVLTAKTKVRLLPPLNIPDELLLKGLAVLKKHL